MSRSRAVDAAPGSGTGRPLEASATMYGLVAAWMAGMLPGSWLAARLARRLTDDGALVRSVLLTLGGCAVMVVLAAGRC
ncbi:hypothetical protein [Micromonospora thermarum]|uniref:hypothetical protein n=1 Tax=Micromonospora thermarum TaxID=2720024 RepID=UPI002816425D|nr:hypothetical protein [Micromonospora thermarum]